MENNKDQKTYSKDEVLSMLESIDDGICLIIERRREIISRLDKINLRLYGMSQK